MHEKLLGYNHLGVFTDDMEQTVKFYTELLGFKKLFFTDDRANSGLFISVIQKDSMKIELLQSTEEGFDAKAGANATLNHIAISCKDIEGVYRTLLEKGVDTFETDGPRFVKGFGEPPVDISVLFFRGPSGERIELYEEF